jgi:putative DNA primase/helicase
MKTAEAAKGRWSEIFEYYGLPPITGKNHYKGECPVCKARGSIALMTVTVRVHGFVYAVAVTG